MVEVENRSRIGGEALNLIRRTLAAFRDVDQIASFAATQHPGYAVHAAFAFADWSHDIVVTRLTDPCTFVFETDCSGLIQRVSIWDRPPTPEDLWLTRIERGTNLDGSAPPDPSCATCRFGGHAPAKSAVPLSA